MNNTGIFKSENNILLNESFDGFAKIFVNLFIGSISIKLALMALSDGNKITAICYAVVAGILLILSFGYLVINIVGKATKCFELKAAKFVGDSDSIIEAEKKLLVHQVGLGALAFITVGGLYTIVAWSLAGIVVSQFF